MGEKINPKFMLINKSSIFPELNLTAEQIFQAQR